ncbi:hypothetical protein BV898_01285 [Hypsibius exemplaris]|uniref:Uncharacterized protein n=1 Tax=Hypsibius exemplaris TaxID=2072580 RepID=A0A1W0XC39_HYPEX|nr:hypothetical protein BV898_01285 [Hypsibius exemplaris]
MLSLVPSLLAFILGTLTGLLLLLHENSAQLIPSPSNPTPTGNGGTAPIQLVPGGTTGGNGNNGLQLTNNQQEFTFKSNSLTLSIPGGPTFVLPPGFVLPPDMVAKLQTAQVTNNAGQAQAQEGAPQQAGGPVIGNGSPGAVIPLIPVVGDVPGGPGGAGNGVGSAGTGQFPPIRPGPERFSSGTSPVDHFHNSQLQDGHSNPEDDYPQYANEPFADDESHRGPPKSHRKHSSASDRHKKPDSADDELPPLPSPSKHRKSPTPKPQVAPPSATYHELGVGVYQGWGSQSAGFPAKQGSSVDYFHSDDDN